jgi:hypothetical protein
MQGWPFHWRHQHICMYGRGGKPLNDGNTKAQKYNQFFQRTQQRRGEETRDEAEPIL